MQVSDDIYLGGILVGGLTLRSNTVDAIGDTVSPVYAQGVGPAGRIFFHNLVPLTKQTNNVALSQHTTLGTTLALTAGTGVTQVNAPDGSGNLVMQFDVPRSVSLTSAGGNNFSGVNFTITGYDFIGRLQTQKMVGPNGTTVNTLKAFMSVLSIVPDTTDGTHNLSAGTSDIFGLPWRVNDATLIVCVKWANTLAQDAGTFAAADATTPATNATGDPRGTYLPSSGSNGTNRLVIGAHLDGTQCGPQARLANLLGVTPV